MKLVGIKALKPGAKLSAPIYSVSGKMILGQGTVLTQAYIDKLKSLKIYSVYIEDDKFDDVEIIDAIDYTTRTIATQVLNEVVKLAAGGKEFDEYKAKEMARRIIEDVKSNNKDNINLFCNMVMDDNIIAHSITVCILASLIADRMQYNFDKMWDLAVGAILHDIGRENSQEELPEHTQKGFDILRKCQGLSLHSSIVAYQHHENFDGSGYPRGLKGDQISEFSRIVSIADFYDTMLAFSTPEKPIMPHQVYEDILARSGTVFDPEIVKIFRDTVAIYPNGCVVEINDGRRGVVIRQNRGTPHRPVIRTFAEGENAVQEDVDLVKNLTVFIREVILD